MIPRGIGINLPQDAGFCDGSAIAEFATAAERIGYDSLWVAESTQPEVLDPLAVLNFAAAASSRPKLGAAVLLTAFRPPVQLARDIATLDHLSGGRSIIGVGLGNDRGMYARYGLSADDRAAHFEASTRLVRRLLAEEHVTAQEPWWQLTDLPRPLGPRQSPTPPIWYGAKKPPALRRAARLGDGWIGAGSVSLPAYSTALDQLRGYLAAEGRDEDRFTIAKRVYIHLGHDDAATRSALRAWFGHHYRNERLADEVVVVGDAAHCAAHVRQLRELGASTIVLHPVLDPAEQMMRLAGEVASRLA